MKNFIYFTIICLFLLSCRQESGTITVLTDDIFLLDTIDHFNAGSSRLKVKVDFYNDDERDLFRYFKEEGAAHYDLVAGTYNSETALTSSFLKKKESKELLKAENRPYYSSFYKFIEQNRGYGLLYALNFPVIINMEDASHDINRDSMVSLEEFARIAEKQNSTAQDNRHISFIPSISTPGKLDYYFAFNSAIMVSDEDITFTTENSRKAFDFYHNFNSKQFSNDVISAYLNEYSNIKPSLYMERKIITFDFNDISRALTLPAYNHKVTLIKGQRNLGLRNKVIAISRESKSPKNSAAFINYLISNEAQKQLLNSSLSNTIARQDVHIPVIKNTFYTLKAESFPFEPSLFENYLNSLAPINFHSAKLQERFFTAYYYTSDSIEKEMIKHDNFLEYFSNQLKSKD